MRWYIFYHFVDIAIMNSYILFKHLAIERSETTRAHKCFREVLMKELVAGAKAAVAAAVPPHSQHHLYAHILWANCHYPVEGLCSLQGLDKKVKTPVLQQVRCCPVFHLEQELLSRVPYEDVNNYENTPGLCFYIFFVCVCFCV